MTLPASTSTAEVTEVAGNVAGRAMLLLVANLSGLTALLVYFGWRRSETQARALGIDENLFGMTTQEYVLRSVGPVFGLLAVVAAAALVWLWIDHGIASVVAGGGTALRAVRALLIVVSPVPLVLAHLARPRWDAAAYVAFPLAIAAGLLLLLYRVHLARRFGGADLPRYDSLRGLIAFGTAICLFLSASNYAEVLGDGLAWDFAATLDDQVQVVVYSSVPLRLDAPGVVQDVVGDADTQFRYRYSGMLLMDRRGGQYFLVSHAWTLEHGVVIVLRDDDRIRLEFTRG